LYEVLGSSNVTEAQLLSYMDIPDRGIPSIYWLLAPRAGIVTEVAYAQSLHETGGYLFPGRAKSSWNNPAGIGVGASSGAIDCHFPTWEAGIRAHLGHLLAYYLPVGTPHVAGFCTEDPRHFAHRGYPNDLAQLTGLWAVPGRDSQGRTYHGQIGLIIDKIRAGAEMTYSPLAKQFTPSPNFWPGTNKPKYIVLHTTQSTGMSAVGWFQNPASQVSAHYVVIEDGSIIAMVDEKNSAWHAGIVNKPITPLYTGVNPNLESVGIEISGFADVPITAQQVDSVANLVRDIRNRYGDLPIIRHHDLDTVNRFDPGDGNFATIQAALEDELTYQQIEDDVKATFRVMINSPEGYNLVENAILHKYDATIRQFISDQFVGLESRIVDRIVERLKNG
jgi:N-acetyl-anhydromuramyl-L-alanine amidase AmpD